MRPPRPRMLFVAGPSGVGKSSLVLAGIVPLIAGAPPIRPVVKVLRPGGNAMAALDKILAAPRDAGAGLLLVVDPFEYRRDIALRLGADVAVHPDDAPAVVAEASDGRGSDVRARIRSTMSAGGVASGTPSRAEKRRFSSSKRARAAGGFACFDQFFVGRTGEEHQCIAVFLIHAATGFFHAKLVAIKIERSVEISNAQHSVQISHRLNLTD